MSTQHQSMRKLSPVILLKIVKVSVEEREHRFSIYSSFLASWLFFSRAALMSHRKFENFRSGYSVKKYDRKIQPVYLVFYKLQSDIISKISNRVSQYPLFLNHQISVRLQLFANFDIHDCFKLLSTHFFQVWNQKRFIVQSVGLVVFNQNFCFQVLNKCFIVVLKSLVSNMEQRLIWKNLVISKCFYLIDLVKSVPIEQLFRFCFECLVHLGNRNDEVSLCGWIFKTLWSLIKIFLIPKY